jgi:hypothetical protein
LLENAALGKESPQAQRAAKARKQKDRRRRRANVADSGMEDTRIET